jgi:hypothetical protein
MSRLAVKGWDASQLGSLSINMVWSCNEKSKVAMRGVLCGDG